MTGTKTAIKLWLDQQPDGKEYEIRERQKKRSLNANGFYWHLLAEIGQVMRVSTTRLHNQYLRDLGLPMRIEDRLVTLSLPDTDTAEKETIESVTYHAKPTSQVRQGRDGVLYRTYIMLRGSHTYNVKEFASLLDLVIQDANALGIETLTEDKLKRMMIAYGEELRRKHNTTA